LRELPRFERSPAFDDLERAVIAYAVAMTRTPVEVADDLYATLSAQLDSAQLVELTAAIAWENYRARFNHALELPAQGFAEGAACALPEPPAAA
jgi:alkylhydroperoxidase family enzyme